MKKWKLFLPVVALVVMITSCQKEESVNAPAMTGIQKSEYMAFDMEGKQVNLESLSLEYPVDLTGSELVLKSAGNTSANGNYSGFGSTWSVAGMNNNGGTHGESVVSGLLNFNLETQYLGVQDNMAIFGGEITQVTAAVPFGSVGDYVYWAVKDNGEGSNAPADQWLGLVLIYFGGPAPEPPLFLFTFPPSYWVDVQNQGDQIQVKD